MASELRKSYPVRRDLFGRVREWVVAVDDVSLRVDAGSTVAIVGESGAGKSTVARLVLRLIEPDSGSVTFEDVDLFSLGREEMRRMRSRVQMVFQDPFSSFDPRKPLGESVVEPLLVHTDLSRGERMRRGFELLERVGLSQSFLGRFPRELSGGQLQRAAIARALAPRPSLIVCDEHVAALDVSVRAQVLNLMNDLQAEEGLAFLFITHDLSLVEVIADSVVVMAEGRVVESGPAADLFTSPRERYTKELLAAVPVPVPKKLRRGSGTEYGNVDGHAIEA